MSEPTPSDVRLTHVDESGAARMVDVSGKDVTARQAVATGRVLVSADVVALLRGDGVPKGDALGVARVAGIMAAKRTPELVPLCHPLAISGVTVARESSRASAKSAAVTSCTSPPARRRALSPARRTTSSRSAPVKRSVLPATSARSTSDASGIPCVWIPRIRSRPLRSGVPT